MTFFFTTKGWSCGDPLFESFYNYNFLGWKLLQRNVFLILWKKITPCSSWHWKLKKVQRVLTIQSSFSCIGLSYFQRIELFWWVLLEIMQNHHLLRLPKSAYFYIVIKSDIDQPSKRTHQKSSILWKYFSPMLEKELWMIKTLCTFFSFQCQFEHRLVWALTFFY